MKLYLSSGTHVGRNSSIEDRVEEIKSEIGEVDAIFAEGREDIGVSKKDRLLNWLTTPLTFLAMGLYLRVLYLISLTGRTDGSIDERLSQEKEVLTYNVDKPPHKIIGKDRSIWAWLHWGLVFTHYFLLGLTVYVTSLFDSVIGGQILQELFPVISLFAGIVLLFVGFVTLLIYLLTSLEERNLYMLQQIDKHRREDDIESACLIIGEKHEEGIRELCNSESMFNDIRLIG
jgi:hypothetical protein